MSLKLDHVVIGVADLEQAAAAYGQLGFTVIRGGEHANGITRNVLVVFQDGVYLELIGWRRPDPGHRWSEVFHAAGEGFLDHALLPDDIGADVAAAQERGLDIEVPVPGGRLRPDGQRLEWRTARSPGADVPFLCGDITPRRLRVEEGEVRRHANGATGVAEVVVAVRNVERSLGRYAALLGSDSPPPARDGQVAGGPARVGTLSLARGTRVTLACPLGTAGPLAAALATRGEGPFSLTLEGERSLELDPALLHGARLALQAGQL
ncbi:VOC family protein [Enterovirga sp.]|jgi:catechol 2,3-dioxygenase-like lactoylglutathione lyase family enzyme|uniref:VOC family protein n=1 Tax=Enterovirga sp. TaxID=2026350 RepID=UPI0026359431|nr:VOC family protein [Enterovirga sp.]MDB5590254.1 hypothetical protein [Enterovirga sp.]